MTEPAVLRPSEAARHLGVRTRVIIRAMYEERVVRVRLADGTLGIPADSLDSFSTAHAAMLAEARAEAGDYWTRSA